MCTPARKCKKFIGKLIGGPDEDQDFETSFLERSKKIKSGFVFAEVEDLASIARKDIERVLSTPCAAAQFKRLCRVLKFDVNLSFVLFLYICVLCLCIVFLNNFSLPNLWVLQSCI